LAPETKVYFNEPTQKLLSAGFVSQAVANLPWKQRDLLQLSKQHENLQEETEEKEETENNEGKMEVEEEGKPKTTLLYIGW
jgi:hypothetical protein